jgi:hypothetical protein
LEPPHHGLYSRQIAKPDGNLRGPLVDVLHDVHLMVPLHDVLLTNTNRIDPEVCLHVVARKACKFDQILYVFQSGDVRLSKATSLASLPLAIFSESPSFWLAGAVPHVYDKATYACWIASSSVRTCMKALGCSLLGTTVSKRMSRLSRRGSERCV